MNLKVNFPYMKTETPFDCLPMGSYCNAERGRLTCMIVSSGDLYQTRYPYSNLQYRRQMKLSQRCSLWQDQLFISYAEICTEYIRIARHQYLKSNIQEEIEGFIKEQDLEPLPASPSSVATASAKKSRDSPASEGRPAKQRKTSSEGVTEFELAENRF